MTMSLRLRHPSLRPLGLLLSLALAVGGASSLAAGTAAGSTISNIGVFDYTDDAGNAQSVSSTPVSITVTQVASLAVGPDGTAAAPGQTVTAAPGSTAVLTYTATNNGNGSDTLKLATQDGSGNAVSGVTYYYDAAMTQPVPSTGIPLNAGQTVTFDAAYTVPTTGAGGSGQTIDPVGTSTFDGSNVDNNNVGLVTAQNVHSVTLSQDNSLNATTPGGAVGSHTLKNTGNTSLKSGDLTLGAAVTDSNGILSSESYQFVDAAGKSGAASTNPTTALNNYLSSVGALAAGASLTLNTTYTTASGKTMNQQATDKVTASFAETSTSTDSYSTATSSGTDTITIVSGQAAVTKTVDNCGADATCVNPSVNSTSAKPGDYLRYTITVKNTGTSALKAPEVHDALNTNLTFVKATLSATQSGATLVYSTDNTTYTTSAPTTLGNSNTIYAAINTSGTTGKPTTSDTLSAGQSMVLVIITKLK